VEGHQGYTEVQVTLTLTDSFGAPVEVQYHTIDGTATTQDGDYIAASGKVTIDPRETPPPTWDTRVLTTTSTSDYDFGVSGNYVVWEGFDGNDWEIFLATVDVSRGTFDVIQLTDNTTNDRVPHVCVTQTGVNVVWVGNDGNDDEVFAYSLNNGVATTRQVTDNSYSDRDPRVSDSLITWWGNDGRSNQVFVFEIANLGDPGANPVNLTDNTLDDRNPQISGRNIVWTRGSGASDTEIMAYYGDVNPLDAPEVIQVTSNSRVDQWPRIDGEKIVWESQVSSTNYEIFLYDMETEATTRVTTNSTHDRYPDISGNDIVWRGNTGSNWEIYHYNAIAQTAPRNISSTSMFSEEEPRIQGNQVVWRAFNGSTYDVYYYDLNLGTGSVNVTNTPGAEWKPAVSDSLLVWRAAHGSNYDIVIGLKNQPVASQTITLRVVGDQKYELDEYFVLAIEVDDDIVAIRDGKDQAVVSILNDDGVLDLGDAPAPYPTLLVDNGARHRIVPGVYLGDPAGPQSAHIDAEPNGQPTAAADGDNRNLSNDEQGVVFNTAIAQGTVASVTVTASTYGYIDAWLDFNRDGDWDDAGEHLFDAAFVEPGANTLHFQVPAGAVVGDSYARFRFSTIGGLSYTGQADNGEVEDYTVAIVSRPPIVNREVQVSGTDGDDLFEFFAGETLTVIINGAAYNYLATEVDTIAYDGGAGTDTVIFHGSTADESVEMWSNKATFQGPHGGGYLVNTINVEVMRAAAGGGNDDVTMRGAAGDDAFEGRPGLATMTGSGYSLEATDFNQVLAVAGTGGSDTAVLRGSTGNDTFVGRPKFGSMTTGGGEVVAAEGFHTTRAYGEGYAAGDPILADRAYFYDSNESDTFRSTPTQARIEPTLGSDYYVEANGFRYVEANSENGGPDYANLYDSAGADKFTGYPHYAQLKDKANALYQVTVNGFRYVAAIGSSHAGDDAEFYDSTDSDTFEADPTYALLRGANFYLRADKFPTARAVGGAGGEDVVNLYDSAGDDLLVASPNDMSLVGAGFKISASNFQHVLAFAGQGNDTVRFFGTEGVDTFIGRPADARLLTAANTFRAYGFDTVQAYGKGGDDEAYLYDTSLGELLTANGSIGDGEDAWADLSNGELNFRLWVADFEYVWVNQTGSGDKKKITDEVDFVFTEGLWEEI